MQYGPALRYVGSDGVSESISKRILFYFMPVAAVLRPDLDSFLRRSNLDANSALHKAVTRIQSHYRGYVVRKVNSTT